MTNSIADDISDNCGYSVLHTFWRIFCIRTPTQSYVQNYLFKISTYALRIGYCRIYLVFILSAMFEDLSTLLY